MINDETVERMYEGLIEGKELTTKELNSYGFNSRDLANLIDYDVLTRVKRGFYNFKGVDYLYDYGKDLIENKDFDKGIACFKKCYELDKTHIESCFQLFLNKIKEHDYNAAFEYFECFYNEKNKKYYADCDLYLYLLNIITNIPENYKKYARYIKFDNIRVNVDNKSYDTVQKQNQIRSAILNKKFLFALDKQNDIIKQNKEINVQDKILKTLLYQAYQVQNKRKMEIISLINNEKYDELTNYLEDLDIKQGLNISDEYTLKLVNKQ